MDEEYIKTLSYEEKIVFLKIFCKMVRADGAVDPEEINFLKNIAQRYGIDNNVMIDIIRQAHKTDAIQEATKIKDRKHALQLIKELCVLANIDNDLQDNELDIIIDSARAMNIEDDKVILINRWVLDSFIITKTGQLILEQNNE